jgi:hypothetical protein
VQFPGLGYKYALDSWTKAHPFQESLGLGETAARTEQQVALANNVIGRHKPLPTLPAALKDA